MVFEIQGKIALITGGAEGIGAAIAKELLKNGLRGITIADINEELGSNVVEELEAEFGCNKATFVKTDVTDKESFEAAFKETIRVYNNLDILVNNAAIINENMWEKTVATNMVGTIRGTLLGLEKYIPQHKSGSEGVIINTSSVAGISAHGYNWPVYTSTKFGIVGLTMALGVDAHFKRTGVRVICICPGGTDTSMMRNQIFSTKEHPQDIERHRQFPKQQPIAVARGVIKMIQEAGSGTIWVVEREKEAYEYVFPPRENFAAKV